jgi:hypothetical protein
MITNYWLQSKGKRIAKEQINQKLKKFVGRPINPIDKNFEKMRKIVIKYFRKNPNTIKLFYNGVGKFNYNFDIEEKNGIIIKAECMFN